MRTLPIAASGCCLLLLAPTASAQTFTGTYTMASPQGGAITLVLQPQPNGRLSGRLSGSGAEFSVEGMVEEGTAMGAMTSPQGRVFFEAVLDGDRLRLTLIEVGAGNMPDYDKTRTLALQRTGGEAVRLDAAGGLESVLQGQAYAYSSTPDGGYSTLRKFYFDGAGRFLYGTETSFSVESGFGYNLQNNAERVSAA